jgi:hypothetical protein
MKRLSLELENNEKKILSLNEKNKKLHKEIEEGKLQLENEKVVYEQSIKDIIQTSSEILMHMKNSLDVDMNDDNLQQDVYAKLKEMIANITLLGKNENISINLLQNSKWLMELKLYFSKTLNSFLDIIFRQIDQENNFKNNKQKWQSTIDRLISTHEEEMNKSNNKP